MSQTEKKEKVIHTRIPAALEDQIKRLAEGLRVPVSNLVRNMLEDAIDMTRRVRSHMPGQPAKNPLDQVFAWQIITLNKETPCASCATKLGAGRQAFLGMTDSPQGGRVVICTDCVPKPDGNNSKKKQRRKS